MKRSDLTVFWQVSDDGGFWRTDAIVYRNSDTLYEPTYRFHREFEKNDFGDDQSVANILKRANGYLDWLIGQGRLDDWFDAPINAAP